MTKRVFLYVTGDDYAALEFEQNCNAQEIYEDMVHKGKKRITIDDENYTDIRIKEFAFVCDDFIEFVQNELCDYDDLKHANIYEVTPI